MAKKQSPSTLLWFIRRKSYVPLCEVRRRFDLDGEEGTFVDGDNGSRIFLGLPSNTAQAIEKLWRQNKIGLELSVEFDCRVVIGVFPISPVRDAGESHHHNGHTHVIAAAETSPAEPHVIDMPDPNEPAPPTEMKDQVRSTPRIIDMPDPASGGDEPTPPGAVAAGH